jgi:hypothetical protein
VPQVRALNPDGVDVGARGGTRAPTLHCLREPMSNTAIAIRNIADVLGPNGVLFGGTVLGIREPHTRSARAFL